MKQRFFFILAFLCPVFSKAQENKDNRMVIEVELPSDFKGASLDLARSRIESRYTLAYNEYQVITEKVINNTVKWTLYNREPLSITSDIFDSIYHGQYVPLYMEPGDSIHVTYSKKEPQFSGKGATNFALAFTMKRTEDSLFETTAGMAERPTGTRIKSLQHFLNWNSFLNKKLDLLLPLIDANKFLLSSRMYQIFKTGTRLKIESIRNLKFTFLREREAQGYKKTNLAGLTNADMCAIYDSTMNGPSALWLQNEAPFVIDAYYLNQKLTFEIMRQNRLFFREKEADTILIPPMDNPVWDKGRYKLAKTKYKGVILEEALAFPLWDALSLVKKSGGFTAEVDSIYADFYARPGYPELKQLVKRFELEQRTKRQVNAKVDYILTGNTGQEFSKDQLMGKLAILSFWYTGCKPCEQITTDLRKIKELFKNDTNVVFVNVSVDKDQAIWAASRSSNKYGINGAIQLYTGGQGQDHPLIKKLAIGTYPELYVFNALGALLPIYPKPDPRVDGGKRLVELINKQLVLKKDGPYVLYQEDEAIAYSIDGASVAAQTIKSNGGELQVQTDLNKPFKVILQKELKTEPAEYTKPEKIFALSDIEGNFDAFRKLLQSNQIIDNNYNWVFGKGHLVFAGDMFDRGSQVTECLWLIYSLEEKAKAAGGYVHFVLGNHEIMNLQGDVRYVQQKYKDNAALLGKTLIELYNENSELGRWLRTKNIVEKVGDILFMHGGISERINRLSITISDINQLARPAYALKMKDYGDLKLNTIMSSDHGPFWYRGYYGKLKQVMVDSTLQKFNVNYIVTGHSIVADTISVHQNGKVINTDTKHAEGKSEALLIEGSNFYRVNAEGKKVLLFVDDKKKTIGNARN